MIPRDTIEFTTALALGAALGAAFALLVAPDRGFDRTPGVGRTAGIGARIGLKPLRSPSAPGLVRGLLGEGLGQRPRRRGPRA